MSATAGPRARWPSRRLAGRILVSVAAVGVVAALLGTVVAWQLVGQLSRSTERSLVLGEDALVTLDDTLDLADGVFGSVDEALDGVVSTLAVIVRLVDDSTDVMVTTAELAGDIAPSLDRVDDALGSLEALSATVDQVLRQLSNLPFGPSYDPDTSFDAAIGDVRRDLAPIAQSLRDASTELDGITATSGELRSELSDLLADVSQVRAALGGSDVLIDSYRATAGDALELARETRGDLRGDLARSRALIVMLGVAVAFGQLVPAWVGRELLASAPPEPPHAPPS